MFTYKHYRIFVKGSYLHNSRANAGEFYDGLWLVFASWASFPSSIVGLFGDIRMVLILRLFIPLYSSILIRILQALSLLFFGR
jgi:hypothetical protein